MRRLEKLKEESIKAGMGVSWTGSVLCHTGFWRISACILLTGTKWNTEPLKNIPDQAHTGLGTDNHSRMWWDLRI